MQNLDRSAILAALRAVFEPLPYVYAMWEGGAAASNRVDELPTRRQQAEIKFNAVPTAVS